MICKCFLPFSRLPLHFVDCSFCCAETLYFDIVPLVYFCFCCLCFWCHIQILPRPISRSLFPMLSSRSFMVSALRFKFLIYLELIFVNAVSRAPGHYPSQCFFAILYSKHLIPSFFSHFYQLCDSRQVM